MNDTTKPRKKVFIALPTYSNNMRRDFVMSLIGILWTDPIPGIDWTIGTIGGDGVARSRNDLARNFLTTTACDIILFIDIDIVFKPEHVARILEFVGVDRPIVGGRYPAKQVAHRWIENDLPNERPDENGLMRVLELGTGFKAYHRSYFEKVRAAFPEIRYWTDGTDANAEAWDFFSMGVVNGRYLSEDYYADYRANRLGIPVFVDTRCELQHEGVFKYPFHSNMVISSRLDIGTLVSMSEMLGAPGHTISEDVETIIKRVANEKAA